MSDRNMAALNVEHEMLQKKVNELKEFIKENESVEKLKPEMEESLTYNSAKQVLGGVQSELKQENEQLQQQMEELKVQYHFVENQLVEAKLLSAQLDMECDTLTVQLKEKNENLKKFTTKVTKLEIELIEAQAKAGTYDRGNTEDDNQQDRSSGLLSPNPKKSKVSDKLKNFFGGKFSKRSTRGTSPGQSELSNSQQNTVEEESKQK